MRPNRGTRDSRSDQHRELEFCAVGFRLLPVTAGTTATGEGTMNEHTDINYQTDGQPLDRQQQESTR